MKKLIALSLVVLLGLVILNNDAFAAKIAFVNLKKVMQESNIGKQAKEQLKTLIEAKKMVIKRKENALKSILEKLKNKKLSKTEKDKLQRQYSKSMADLQQYQAQASEEVRQKEMEATNKILTKAIKIIKDYAQKHGIDAVFETSQGNVIYWNDSMDITNTIIKLMNSNDTNKK